MKIDLEMPHTVYVVVAKDKNGFKRGFEKMAWNRVFFDYAEAVDNLRTLGDNAVHYTIGEAIIGWMNE